MNTKNTKYKNSNMLQAYNKRLIVLEKFLKRLLDVSEIGKVNNAGQNLGIHNRNNYLNALINSVQGSNKRDNIDASSFSVKLLENNKKTTVSNLKLTQGQIMAELSSMISRLGSRNS